MYEPKSAADGAWEAEVADTGPDSSEFLGSVEAIIPEVIESRETAVWLLRTLISWPILRSLGLTPGFIVSRVIGVVTYLLAMIQKVSPASTVIWVVFVLPGANATIKSEQAAMK